MSYSSPLTSPTTTSSNPTIRLRIGPPTILSITAQVLLQLILIIIPTEESIISSARTNNFNLAPGPVTTPLYFI